jgi:nesprin-1
MFQTLHQDVQSYQRVIDGVSDKAQALASSSGDQRIASQLADSRKKYNNLCSTAKEYVKQYEDFVREHQQYYDGFVECRDWLCTMKERLSMCADVSGDRHAVQSRLERIQVRICDPANVIFFRCQCLCGLLFYITCRIFCAKGITVQCISNIL